MASWRLLGAGIAYNFVLEAVLGELKDTTLKIGNVPIGLAWWLEVLVEGSDQLPDLSWWLDVHDKRGVGHVEVLIVVVDLVGNHIVHIDG